jgi:hypothetical protein
MNATSRDSAHITCRPRTAIAMALSSEERATYRRWAWAVVTCYCALFALGCLAVVANHSSTNSDNQVAQTALQMSSSPRAVR